MADALDDDWWTPVADIPEKPKKQKRSLELESTPDTTEPKPPKKKKKKKKTILEEPTQCTLEALNEFLDTEFSGKLSKLELDELLLDDSCFIEAPVYEQSSEISDFSTYLLSAIPTWEKQKRKVGETRGSPALIVVAAGGQRAADLLRGAKLFRGSNCRSMKLFAKHLKLSEQAQQLSSQVVHICVGTSHRITKLIDSGALSRTHDRY